MGGGDMTAYYNEHDPYAAQAFIESVMEAA